MPPATRPKTSDRTAKKAPFRLTDRIADPLDLEAHLPYQITILANLLTVQRDPRIRKLTPLGVRELRVLLNIGSYMPVRAADVAYHTRLDSFTVSRAVKVLAGKRLVQSTADPIDGRVVQLELTRGGVALYQKVKELFRERAERVFSVLTGQERTQFSEILLRIEAQAETVLADEAMGALRRGGRLAADQKEILRWFRRGRE